MNVVCQRVGLSQRVGLEFGVVEALVNGIGNRTQVFGPIYSDSDERRAILNIYAIKAFNPEFPFWRT